MDKKGFSRRQFLKRGLTLTGSGVALGAVGNVSAATPNSIVTENALPGTPQTSWDLSGEGQYSGYGLGAVFGNGPVSGVTHYLEGFADDMSVNHGTTINFKINTDCKNYRIDIYRMGYYGGTGARLITTIAMTSASVQPTPLNNVSTGLVDAGNWSVTASWAVPATAVSGVYVCHLVRQDGVSGENHIVFVVRDDGTAHDIVFQTSDPTWQAYNGWGGPSLYGNGVTVTGFAFKVSYNRPFATRDSIGTYAGPQDFFFGAETAAIRWLEANGYDVSYIAGVDTDRLDTTGKGGQLVNHKVFLSVGHDEYWSGNQRTNVESARAAGVHLAFWSGNEVFWKTRWEPSTDPSATAYRTLVCYKETRANTPIDPLDPPTWTGSWRDPRFSPPADGGRPENALIGQIWTVDSWEAGTITIPYPMTLLRFWRNTNVAKTTTGQTASLVPNYLGYEWDESPDNGYRPAGLFHLSSTTKSVGAYMLDYGATDGAYVATHNLSLYRYAPGGSIVFGAGTVFWAWGLDADHDLQSSGPETDDNAVTTDADTFPATTTPVDPNVQQATVNLLADMGVQPQTLQTGLVAATQSTDTTPPVSTITAPGTVTAQQIVAITGTATDTGGLVAGVEVSTDGGSTWHPATGTSTWTYSWWPQSPGTFNVLSRAVDDSLNLETPGSGISVVVNPGTTLSLFNPTAIAPFGVGSAPSLAGPASPPDTSAVELGVQFLASSAGSVTGIRFYKNPWNTGTHVGNLWSATGTLLGSATFTNETAYGWQTVNLPSAVTLIPGTTYVVSYHSPGGNYSVDPTYFTTARTSSVLTAPVSGGSSVYAYSNSSVFPSNSSGAANYWADVVFASNTSGNQPPIANNDSGFIVTENTPLTIPASTLLANDLDPNGYTLSIQSVSAPVNGTVVLNAVTPPTVTFTPTTGYTGAASFTYTITNGHANGTASANVSLTVTVQTVSLFSATSVPGTVTENDPNAVELGVKFSSSTAGSVVGVRFYKGPQNTGTHVGNLWSSAGSLLGSATFTGETASGWQQANFSSPIALAAGTTYIVSYHSSGFYSADANYFANAVTSGPLTAPTSASSGGNGVYAYGSTSAFPANTYNASNYWVDLAFASGGSGTLPPVANNITGLTTAENTALVIPASQILASDSDPNGFTLSIQSVSAPVNGTVVLNAVTPPTVTFTPTTGYTGAASFTYTITNGHAGGTASATVSLTVTAPGTKPPVANNITGLTTNENTALVIPASQILASDSDPNGFTLSIQSVSAPVNGTVVLNAVTPPTVTFTPTTNYVGAASFTYTITNGHAGGTASATVSLTVNSTGITSYSLFAAGSTPATLADTDPNQVELGVKFQSSVAGRITAIRFYKSTTNTGTHTAHLWSSTGTSLATATFTGETASGWQQVTLTTPVTIAANTIYVASYHTTKGHYSADSNYFATAHVNAVLTAPAGTATNGNGVYVYSSTSVFPTNTFSATNYWVDVVFLSP